MSITETLAETFAGKTCECCGAPATTGVCDFDELPPRQEPGGKHVSQWRPRAERHWYCQAHARRGLRYLRDGRVINHMGVVCA